MNNEERELDLALAEAEQENRLLRARNERLEREILAAADAEAARIHADGMVTVGHMRQMIAAEREACAKVCEQDEFQVYETAERCAAAIRARGQA